MLCERYGWTFDTVDNMSFEQIWSAMSGGKKFEGIEVQTVAEVQWMADNPRLVWGY